VERAGQRPPRPGSFHGIISSDNQIVGRMPARGNPASIAAFNSIIFLVQKALASSLNSIVPLGCRLLNVNDAAKCSTSVLRLTRHKPK
jgi:hypothetical protein